MLNANKASVAPDQNEKDMPEVSSDLLTYFKGFCSTPSIVLFFVYAKCHFSLSYREIDEIMIIHGPKVPYSTLQLRAKGFMRLIEKILTEDGTGLKGGI